MISELLILKLLLGTAELQYWVPYVPPCRRTYDSWWETDCPTHGYATTIRHSALAAIPLSKSSILLEISYITMPDKVPLPPSFSSVVRASCTSGSAHSLQSTTEGLSSLQSFSQNRWRLLHTSSDATSQEQQHRQFQLISVTLSLLLDSTPQASLVHLKAVRSNTAPWMPVEKLRFGLASLPNPPIL